MCSPNAFSETTTATMMLMMVIACVCVCAVLRSLGRSAWKFGGHEWVQHTAHARNHSDGDKKQPTCASKEGRKERGRNWWHPCSGTTHLGYEETLNSYGAASLAERSDKTVDMVLNSLVVRSLPQ